jgi:hypothetical protein
VRLQSTKRSIPPRCRRRYSRHAQFRNRNARLRGTGMSGNGGLPSARNRNRFSERTSHHYTPQLLRLAAATREVRHSDFSGRSTSNRPAPITMRLNSLMVIPSCSQVSLRDSLRPYCSSQRGPQLASKPRSRREQPTSAEADSPGAIGPSLGPALFPHPPRWG